MCWDWGKVLTPIRDTISLNVEKSQADKFRKKAKELETDNDEKRFDENLKKIAKSDKKGDGGIVGVGGG